ncbi:YeeE/YedE thiosulfate transporter family protein [Sulfurimonas microaerophilic]|uniref:YeeE/YedE thiosulfate transporter family protein n=1 Tax=Sulfurimonas microaerophilic TaxID=3058392 RepID=UPI00271557FF|nr:YeeE/YedE thiosulfate transporter family protein [Sulfurimonas sp. hsl 1-7]
MIDRVIEMFEIVANGNHGSVWLVLFIGFVFGAIILYSRLDKFEKMAGFMIFEDTLVPRMAMTTVALSSVGFYFLVQNGYATFSIKPIFLTGLIVGAIIFGIGLVILGKCPSAFFVSVSEGRVDAFVGVLGGMTGGAVFTLLYPSIKEFMGPYMGAHQVIDFFSDYSFVIVAIFSTVLLLTAYFLPTIEYKDPADFKTKE